MEIKIGTRWEGVIADAIASGRYASVEDVVAEGLRHVAEEEARFRWLKQKLDKATATGGAYTDDDVSASIEEALSDLDAD